MMARSNHRTFSQIARPAVITTRHSSCAPILLTACLLGACGHKGQLVPDTTAEVVVGAEAAAVATVAGIRCSAAASSWQGLPRDLGSEMTPIKVRIRNQSGKPIRLLYESFALVGEKGQKYRPLPLLPLNSGNRNISALMPAYASQGFFVAQRLGHAYPAMEAWPRPLVRNERFYRKAYAKWQDDEELPSRSMLVKGLPEGVLDNGGIISGYLYFEAAARKEKRLNFRFDASEGDREERVALIKIPFLVQ